MNCARLLRGFERRVNRRRRRVFVEPADLAAADPTSWHEALPARGLDWDLRLPSGPLPGPLRARLSPALPARGVMRLRDAWVIGDHGWIFDARGRLLVAASAFADARPWLPDVFPPLLPLGVRRLRGRTLSLLSNWSSTNFYHHLVESLPRIGMLDTAGWRWDDFDRILYPAGSTPVIERLARGQGLPRDRLVEVAWGGRNLFRCDELVCTSFLGGRRTVAPEQIDWLRSRPAAAPGAGAGPRLFLARRARTRRLRNEETLFGIARARGFVAHDPGDTPLAAEAVFARAERVIAPHGAALANLVFCRPGARVLELFASDHAFPYYYTLCRAAGLSYDCLVGPSDTSAGPADPWATWNSPADFVVDPDAFSAALDRLLA